MQARVWEMESGRYKRLGGTCFKQISEVSHNKKRLD